MDKTQDSKRRLFSPHEKVAAVKRHLLERVPISAICEELKIAPNVFYHWQQTFFENGHLTFETDRKSKSVEATKDRKIEQLESKLQRKKRSARRVDGGARAAKKRTWGALSNRWAPHETRDELVDFVRHWGEKSEIPNCRLLGWIGIRRPTTRTMPGPRINLGH